jgi:hypothetical protein
VLNFEKGPAFVGPFLLQNGKTAANLHATKGSMTMSKRAALIEKYAADLKAKCQVEADMALLTRVTIACGPSIYDADAETVAASDPAEMARVRANFLIKKLGLPDSPALDAALDAVIETYGRSERQKYRAVVYYLLVLHFRKQAVFA